MDTLLQQLQRPHLRSVLAAPACLDVERLQAELQRVTAALGQSIGEHAGLPWDLLSLDQHVPPGLNEVDLFDEYDRSIGTFEHVRGGRTPAPRCA